MATVAQESAFTGGAGGALTMADFNMMFALIASTFILLFAAWFVRARFRAWSSGGIDLYDFVWAVVRVLIVVVIYGYYVRP